MIKSADMFLVLIVMAGLFFVAGCGEQAKTGAGSFIFEAQREGAIGQSKGGSVYVQNFSIDRPFDGCRFVYRRADNRYEKDYYSRFASSPEVLITQKCRDWFEKSGVLGDVINASSIASADNILEGNIISLYGDFADSQQAFAVLQMRLSVIKKMKHKKEIVFSKDYSQRVKIAGDGPGELVSGYDKCLVGIFSSFEKDVTGLNLK